MFEKNTYFVKEQVSFMKLVDRYDIFDAETRQMVAFAKENISGGMKFLRLLVSKSLLPTLVEIVDTETNQVAFSIKKDFSLLTSTLHIIDKNGREVGYFKSRIFTIGGRFDVFHTDGKKFAEVKGNWKGWTFQFLDLQGNELGLITKKWAGIGKEFFSSADNYVISLNQQIQRDEDLMALLIMAGLSVDIVLKERK